jgi:hypothetical protein
MGIVYNLNYVLIYFFRYRIVKLNILYQTNLYFSLKRFGIMPMYYIHITSVLLKAENEKKELIYWI